jgi:hypothetical protein
VVVGGGGGWWVCKPILVLSFGFGQAEQLAWHVREDQSNILKFLNPETS